MKGGGFRAGLSRVFGESDNPLMWAITLGTIWHVRVRLHVSFVLYGVGLVLFSIPKDTLGLGYTLLEVGLLFSLVLLHEFGHCAAARLMGGEADEVMLWPLGGLATTHPPDTWRAHLGVALGGPAVNAALAPVFALTLYAIGRADAILFDPRHVNAVLATFGSWWQVAIWWGHFLNLTLLAFNLLVPMLPLDGGQALRAALWGRVGRRRADELGAVVGLVSAGALCVAGIASERTLLIAIGAFGALVCWGERKRLRAPDEIAETAYSAALREQERTERARAERAAAARREQESEAAAMDRVLAKIAKEGMGSLTSKERRLLEDVTKRKRGGG